MWISRWLSGKESACQAEDVDLIPGSGRSPGGGNSNPLQYSCLEKSHRQRSLVGCSPKGHRVGYNCVCTRVQTHTHTQYFTFNKTALNLTKLHNFLVIFHLFYVSLFYSHPNCKARVLCPYAIASKFYNSRKNTFGNFLTIQ